MRTAISILLIASPAFADADSDARAALAYSLASTMPPVLEKSADPDFVVGPFYSGYQRAAEDSRREQCPLVVFVGGARPRHFQGTRTLILDEFAGVKESGIVVGVWHSGDFLRHDLPADATDSDVWKVILAPPPPGYPDESPIAPNATNSQAVANYLAQPRNVGRCECGATGQGCHCNPAWTCGREPCALHNPLLNPNIVAPVPTIKK